MVRTSVKFEHLGHCVEYGVLRAESGERASAQQEVGCPFVEVDETPIAVTGELLWGWKRGDFGTEVRAYMLRYYSDAKE